MRAMQLAPGRGVLEEVELPVPVPAAGEVLLRVLACGVCRTDLHIVDGELPTAVPVIPGHEIVGVVEAVGPSVTRFARGDRVGVPWLGWTCGTCDHCRAGRENLCEQALFTGYTRPGGYAEWTVADARYCFPLPPALDDAVAAPLLCAGLIGYRSLRFTGDAASVGIYGFGAAAHLVTQVAVRQGRRVAAFVRPGDEAAAALARDVGASWVGGSDEAPPDPLDAAIIFAPVGALVPAALRAVRPGGVVVCGGIHMSDIPSFPYALLWRERVLRSVANLTRADGDEFLALAGELAVTPRVETFALEDANVALDRLRAGAISGAAVLLPGRRDGG